MLRSQPGPGPLLQAALDPLVAIGSLAGAVSFFGGPVRRRLPDPRAAASSRMTFPGGVKRPARGASAGGPPGELTLDIATGWVAIVGLLFLLGWATRTIEVFDQRVLLAWVARHARGAVRRAPPAAGRAAARARRRGHAQASAVIAGAGDLGRKLAERLRDPMLGVRCRRLLRRPRARAACSSCTDAQNLGGLDGARRLRARQPRRPDLHRAADGVAAAHPASCSTSCATPRRRSTSCRTSSSPT